MRSLLVSSLAVLALLTLQFQPSAMKSAASDSCSDNVYEVNFDKKYSESLKEGCKDKFRDLESILPESKNNERPKQEFTTEYIETCTYGLERFFGCDANPDTKPCSDGTTPTILVVRYSGGERNGEIYDSRLVCPEDELDLPDNIVREVVVTPDHFRRYPILGSRLYSSPNEFSLVNGFTHMWASSEQQTFSDQIEGQRVTIKAIPIRWNWSYGDGTTEIFESPGMPHPNHTLDEETPTSHIYYDTGVQTVRVTTIYRGEFRVGAGPWQPVGGQAAVPSEPIEIDVWRTKKELIANE